MLQVVLILFLDPSKSLSKYNFLLMLLMHDQFGSTEKSGDRHVSS
jgi:hypothetical protein